VRFRDLSGIPRHVVADTRAGHTAIVWGESDYTMRRVLGVFVLVAYPYDAADSQPEPQWSPQIRPMAVT
jgi:hypothetical protein